MRFKLLSLLFICLMLFSTVGVASATSTSKYDNNLNNVPNETIIVNDLTVNGLQNAINNANDGDTIIINGSISGNGSISCKKHLLIVGQNNCKLYDVGWNCTKDMLFDSIIFSSCCKNKGGAIYCDGCLSVYNCEFTNNSAAMYGGAIYCGDFLTVSNSEFDDNYAGSCGGAIYSHIARVYSSKFIKNEAHEDGGAIYSLVDCWAEYSSFEGNFVKEASVFQCEGGAIYSDGTGFLRNSNFTNNYAYDYGGAVWSDDTVDVKNCTFENNSVTDNRGGAIYMDDSYDLRVSGSSFYGNHANDKGGAIYCEGNSATVYLDSHNSFENNTAKEGSVVFADGYFESIKSNWWGTSNPNWDNGLVVEWKAWPWSNINHHDDSPLSYNPNL